MKRTFSPDATYALSVHIGLVANQLGTAYTSALVALENTSLLDKHYAFVLLGLVQLRRQNHPGAIEAFEAGLKQAVELISNDPQNYQALDRQCLALWGLNICKRSNSEAEAIRSYTEARAINNDPGVVKRALRLLEILVEADDDQGLKEWFQKITSA